MTTAENSIYSRLSASFRSADGKYRRSAGLPANLGSLLLGYYRSGKLIYAGSVGTALANSLFPLLPNRG
jgi:hypothetical protein